MYKPFSKILIRTPLQSLAIINDQKAKSNPSDYFMEGIYLSSPEFYTEVLRNQDKQDNRIKLSFSKYWIRSAVRATPYGTFAGCGLLDVSNQDQTDIVLTDINNYKKSVRLDMNIVTMLTEALVKEPWFVATNQKDHLITIK